jgi:hypothetical protein
VLNLIALLDFSSSGAYFYEVVGVLLLAFDPKYFCPDTEALWLAASESKSIRLGGQIPMKSFPIFDFRRKSP